MKKSFLSVFVIVWSLLLTVPQAFGLISTGFSITAKDVPAGTTGVIAVIDGNGITPIRISAPASGLKSVTFNDTNVSAGSGYRIRVIAYKGTGTFPSVIGGGKMLNQTVTGLQITSVIVTLTQPTSLFDPANPAASQPGAPVTLKWSINDPANFLDDAGNQMRMFTNDGVIPSGNFYGTQTKGTLLNKSGDDYNYSITFNAPSSPTTLNYQFGESPGVFGTGTQAPFIVTPNMDNGETLKTLTISSITTGLRINASNLPAGTTGIIGVVDGNGSTINGYTATSTSTASLDLGVPPGNGYRIRVIAIKGTAGFPSIVAGGKVLNQNVTSGQITTVAIPLSQPTLHLSANNPSAALTGQSMIFSWSITDPSNYLDDVPSRMRLYSSEGSPPAGNLIGTPRFGPFIGKTGDTYSYSITFTAPSTPTMLYYQFGEAANPFIVNSPTTMAPFMVLPDLNTGSSMLTLATTQGYPLSVTVTGTGTVTSSSSSTGMPADINCTSGVCSAIYPAGSQVSLTAAPPWYSATTWGGVDSGTGNTASVTMIANKDVSATFIAADNVELVYPSGYYGSIATALNAVINGSTTGIKIRNMDFPDVLNFNKPSGTTITLYGGWANLNDASSTGFSTISNKVTVQNGKVIADAIKISP